MPTLTWVDIGVYALAATIYVGYLLGHSIRLGPPPPNGDAPEPLRSPFVARALLAVAVSMHFAEIGYRCIRGINPVSSTPEAISLVAFLIAAGYLIASFRTNLAAAGAFAVPAALAALVMARVVPAEVDAPRMGSLGRVHILLAVVGVAVFALAAVLALLSLFEDRQLKRKRFDRVVGRGTPLDTLDRLALRCVSIGFPIFTIAIVTGAIWVARLGLLRQAFALRPEYALAVVTWAAFGVLLIARLGAGWRGRRAAWLTLGGFGGAMLVLAAYFLRHAA
ncbi:MAG TPA: cytochrome c biogenesis protein CcsA [Polyangia bacterium]|nr:cytochrome c biogenesis protein CcsA [Polyangia bacterium]